jgi:molecular chaperone DnaK
MLDGIPTAPRGIPQIEVKFDIDVNGILNVSATDKATGKEQKITITASSGLSEEEVEKMKKEAELHADEDKKKKESIEIKNHADAVVFQTEKLIEESADKIKEEDKKELEEKLEALKKIKDSGDVENIKVKMDELNVIAQKIGAAMYQQPDQSGTETKEDDGEKGKEKKDDGPVEGEFEEGNSSENPKTEDEQTKQDKK